MKQGIVIINGYNEESTPLLQKASRGHHVLTNYKLPFDHTFLRFSDKPQAVWGAKEFNIATKDVKMNLSNPQAKQLAWFNEISKRCDETILVFPDQTKINKLLILLGLNSKKPFHVVIGSQPVKDDLVKNFIKKSDLGLLKQQYESLVGVKREAKQYDESELIKTPNGATLRQYQQQMVDFVLEQKRVGLFVDMGLGKTLATLAAIDKLAQTKAINPQKPVLIIAPITVALDTWAREASKWGYDMDVKINIQLPKKKREELLDGLLYPQEKLTLVTTNPHQLDAIFKYYKQRGVRAPFEMFVVDELSMFKSATAKRFETLHEVSKYAKYFIGLTGTPAPNNLLDVWSQLALIDVDNLKLFGRDFYVYRDQFFEPDIVGRNGDIYSYKLKPNAEYEIYNRMSRTVISMQSKGLVDLPSITYTNHYVQLPTKAMKTYKEFDTKIRNKLRALEDNDVRGGVSVTTDEGDFTVANSAVLMSKLTQLSSGAMYDNILSMDDSKAVSYVEFHDAKLKALQEIIETSTSPILIFFYFKSELERMADYFDFTHLDAHASDFQETISKWNKGEIPVLVAHPASAGHGLNLQDGGHTIIWLTTTWSNEQYRQANKRLHRSGQKNPVSVIHIVATDTVDEEIISRIDTKEEQQSKLMETLDVAMRPGD